MPVPGPTWAKMWTDGPMRSGLDELGKGTTGLAASGRADETVFEPFIVEVAEKDRTVGDNP